MEILLVDDEEHILQILGDFLVDCGYEVCTAEDGVEALQILEQKGDVDLIVSDIRMPRLDGLKLLQAVRVRFPGIPVVLMTGHGDEDVAAAALHEGANDYLRKPVKLNEFMACVEQVEARSRLESEVLDNYQKLLHAPERQTAGDRVREEARADEEKGFAMANVLLVDPHQTSRELAAETLTGLGHQAQVAGSGEEALVLFAEGLFDVVIAEVDLPGMDGTELIQHLRASDPTVSSIILTSRGDQETAVRVLEAGGRGFLVKPFTAEDLGQRITRALRERKRFVDTRLLLGDLLHMRTDLQKKVVERERYLRHLIDAAPFGIVSTDRQGQILTFSGRAERIYGYRQDEIVGSHLSRLFAPDTAASAGVVPENGRPVAKAHHLRKNGEGFPALVHRRDIRDHRGECIARLHVVEDLTEREQMEAQLLYAERLSLLGQLAPRIVHEFKTPLQVIIGQAELALLELDEGQTEAVRQYVDTILPSTRQLQDLVRRISNLGKPEESREQEVDLKAELEKTLDSLQHLGVVKYCRLTQDLDESLPAVYGDPVQLQQVFRNLIVNAAQAMEVSEIRDLELSLKVSAAGEAVEAGVRDTGGGIPEENMERIFQPFFTTKPEGKGTGLGLSIVKTILDRHGASLEVESEVGRGTHFRLFFPAFRPAEAAENGTKGEERWSDSERRSEESSLAQGVDKLT